VDEFFDYRFGKLPYRSLQFKHETHHKEWFQENSVVNYPNEHLYTRVTEFKYLTGQVHPKTSIVYEFPRSEGDPYYPVPKPENQELYKQYKQLADATTGVYFVGRLATYKYYNMDQVTAQALSVFKKIKTTHRIDSVKHGKTMLYPSYGLSSRLATVPDVIPAIDPEKESGEKVA
jgi:UDP-galactopyranose mutase